mgnify:CR=1 FL=1
MVRRHFRLKQLLTLPGKSPARCWDPRFILHLHEKNRVLITVDLPRRWRINSAVKARSYHYRDWTERWARGPRWARHADVTRGKCAMSV